MISQILVCNQLALLFLACGEAEHHSRGKWENKDVHFVAAGSRKREDNKGMQDQIHYSKTHPQLSPSSPLDLSPTPPTNSRKL